jgi:hypothetical protein
MASESPPAYTASTAINSSYVAYGNGRKKRPEPEHLSQEPLLASASSVPEVLFHSVAESSVEVRLAFVRKVYVILACQLGFTVLFCLIMNSIPTFQQFSFSVYELNLPTVLDVDGSILFLTVLFFTV